MKTSTNSAKGPSSSIMSRLNELAEISEQADGLTRRYLSPEHRSANDLVGKWMASAGMSCPLPRYIKTPTSFPVVGSLTMYVRDCNWPTNPQWTVTLRTGSSGTWNHTGTTSVPAMGATSSRWKGSLSSQGVGGGSSAVASQGGVAVSACGVEAQASSSPFNDCNEGGREPRLSRL